MAATPPPDRPPVGLLTAGFLALTGGLVVVAVLSLLLYNVLGEFGRSSYDSSAATADTSVVTGLDYASDTVAVPVPVPVDDSSYPTDTTAAM